jgi:ABC-type branched-subunit amino acid transport system substrate-binding protein
VPHHPAMPTKLLNDKWRTWIRTNVARGCSRDELSRILVKEGFDLVEIGSELGPTPNGATKGALLSELQPKSAPNAALLPGLQSHGAPRLELYTAENFVDSRICAALVELIKTGLRPSTISAAGAPEATFRTSRTCDLDERYPVVRQLNRRICAALSANPAYAEATQGQYYEVGQEFKAHTDYFEAYELERFSSATWGQRTWNAFQLGCDLINEQGGIKSMGGAKLKYIVADTESKPEVAGSQTEKVVGRGAVAITGTNQSAATIVATQIAEREGVPFVCATDVDPLITSRGFKYTFRTSPLVSAYAADLLEYVKELGQKAGKPARTLAILSENSIVGQSSVEGATKVGKELGYEVVAGDTYDASKTQNFASYISKYKGGNVDVVIGHNKPSDAILITRTMKELNYNPMAYGGILGGHVSTEYVNALGKDADNVLATTSWSPDADIPGLKELAKKYLDRFK